MSLTRFLKRLRQETPISTLFPITHLIYQQPEIKTMTFKNHLNTAPAINLRKERSEELRTSITTRHEDMRLLIAFAIGKKTLPEHYVKAPRYWQRTMEDDKRLMKSLCQLREQIHRWEEELALLQGGQE